MHRIRAQLRNLEEEGHLYEMEDSDNIPDEDEEDMEDDGEDSDSDTPLSTVVLGKRKERREVDVCVVPSSSSGRVTRSRTRAAAQGKEI